MKAADDISTENPKVVDVFRNGAARKLELDQVIDEGTETLQELLTWRGIFGKSHPSLRPFMEVLAATELVQRENGLRPVWSVRYGRSFLSTLRDSHGTDYDSKPVLPLLGIRL
jgi:hypothetical protein